MLRGRRWRLAIIAAVLVLAVVGAILWDNRISPPVPGTYAGEAWSGNGLRIPFRWCPPGTFQMGSPAIEPNRRDNEDQVAVTLTRGFWLGQTEVTQGQWLSVLGTTPWKSKPQINEEANYPAVHVSHSGELDSATVFCERFTARERAMGRLPPDWEYRLPTQAEWEYACRAGTTTAYCFGNDGAKLGRHAWFEGNCKRALSGTESWLNDRALYAHPVGAKLPNSWGLRDMHGNVWEWCADMVPGSDRVIRGGCWFLGSAHCRTAIRSTCSPAGHGDFIGFRLALSPTGNSAEHLDK